MSVRRWAKAIERRGLRPLRDLIRRAGWGGNGGRIARLERRVEELEGLVRELTGLAYLRLDADSSPAESPQPRDPADTQEAA
ncbi:MAG: hypothetical protein O3C39_00190 [Planctomycetota bacterium]|jgi:hypothetical protein|nr:hypothetical protein [Planctomycetota bacterium]MDA1200080.1 hypothetical protein [Planctomycetota bacterium]